MEKHFMLVLRFKNNTTKMGSIVQQTSLHVAWESLETWLDNMSNSSSFCSTRKNKALIINLINFDFTACFGFENHSSAKAAIT
jgi:hypothetical protein